jgi:hypothetical protein
VSQAVVSVLMIGHPHVSRGSCCTWPCLRTHFYFGNPSWVAPVADRWSWAADQLDGIVLAVNEAVANAVEHAYLDQPTKTTVLLAFWYQLANSTQTARR